MAEHKLNEQWIEEIDGKKHMLKAVEGENCTGCAFGKMFQVFGLTNIHVCDREDDCPLEYSDTVVKYLGILNEEGLIPCPFCWEYPTPKEELDEHDERIYAIEHECNIDMTTGWNHDKQTVIDAWNRRA